MLQEAAESIWKSFCALQFESDSSKRSKAKWPLSEGEAVLGSLSDDVVVLSVGDSAFSGVSVTFG